LPRDERSRLVGETIEPLGLVVQRDHEREAAVEHGRRL
jgi:hypothetical protein